jgi:hypothetical protein
MSRLWAWLANTFQVEYGTVRSVRDTICFLVSEMPINPPVWRREIDENFGRFMCLPCRSIHLTYETHERAATSTDIISNTAYANQAFCANFNRC